jgi:hypothetical protein
VHENFEVGGNVFTAILNIIRDKDGLLFVLTDLKIEALEKVLLLSYPDITESYMVDVDRRSC